MADKEYNFEIFELTEDQRDVAWDYIKRMQDDITEKSTGEQLRKLFKKSDFTLGQKIYIAYIFGRTEDIYREFRKIESEID